MTMIETVLQRDGRSISPGNIQLVDLISDSNSEALTVRQHQSYGIYFDHFVSGENQLGG